MSNLNINYGLINISQRVETNNTNHIVGLVIIAIGLGVIASSNFSSNSKRRLKNGKI